MQTILHACFEVLQRYSRNFIVTTDCASLQSIRKFIVITLERIEVTGSGKKKPGEHLVFPGSHQISTNFIIYNEPVMAVIAHRKLAFCMRNRSSDKSPVVPQNPIRNNQSTIYLRVFICLHLYPFHIRLYFHLIH